jgi:toxin ParE1/3/4
MAEIIWTKPSLNDLDDIAGYIALDKPHAAARFVGKVFNSIERLADHPLSGKQVEELPGSPYREIVIPPCRVFYRPDKDAVYILHVMRGERLLRDFLLEERNKNRKNFQPTHPSGRRKRRR